MTIGYAMTGSFCTFTKSLEAVHSLVQAGHTVIPIMSETAYTTDTRFGTAAFFINALETLTGNEVIHRITEAEPIGPQKRFDVLCVAPCTSNTLAKLALGITDTAVTMAVKSHLRNARPVVIGISTNDALGNAAKNIGALMNYRCYYFIPFTMDDPVGKPRSMVCDFTQTLSTIEAALEGREPVQKVF